MTLDGAEPLLRIVLARAYFLNNRWDDALKLLRRDNVNPGFAPAMWRPLARLACWRGDPALVRELLADPALKSPALADTRIKLQGLAEQRLLSIEQFLPPGVTSSGPRSPRGWQSHHLGQAEYYCYAGQYDRALDELRQSVELGLNDLSWMDGCPLLQPLRATPAFGALRSQVAAVAQATRRAFGLESHT
jgi:serine/threonine-protein kinase